MSLRILILGFLLSSVPPISFFSFWLCWSLSFKFPAVTDAHGLSVNIKEWVASLFTCAVVGSTGGDQVGTRPFCWRVPRCHHLQGFVVVVVLFAFVLSWAAHFLLRRIRLSLVTIWRLKAMCCEFWAGEEAWGSHPHFLPCFEHSSSRSPPAVPLVPGPGLLWGSFSSSPAPAGLDSTVWTSSLCRHLGAGCLCSRSVTIFPSAFRFLSHFLCGFLSSMFSLLF